MYQRFFAKYVPNLPPLEALIHNVSLALVNSDQVFHGPRAFLPNVVEIGGAHIAHQPAKGLPQDLSHYFSIADDGIFVFTLGGSAKPSTVLNKEKLAALNHVFRSIPTAAAFVRWDDRQMEHQSDNVVIGQWIPQVDMLAQDNVRLLITNGGLLSIYEAIYYKKPIIGMPLFGDQFQNVALVEEHGIGRMMSTDNITVESFEEILRDVRTNPVYQENIERLNRLMFGNEQSSPAERVKRALEKVEYVLETKGAVHWRSPALRLSIWQLYLVDVALTLILIVFVILAVPAAVIGIVLRRANARIGQCGEEEEATHEGMMMNNRTNSSNDVSRKSSNNITRSLKTNSAGSSSASTPTEEMKKGSSGGGGGKGMAVKKRN